MTNGIIRYPPRLYIEEWYPEKEGKMKKFKAQFPPERRWAATEISVGNEILRNLSDYCADAHNGFERAFEEWDEETTKENAECGWDGYNDMDMLLISVEDTGIGDDCEDEAKRMLKLFYEKGYRDATKRNADRQDRK